MAQVRSPTVAVALLVLALITPEMVASIKIPRMQVSPRTKKGILKFLKDHASDIADLVPSFNSNDEESQQQAPRNSAGGRSQQLAAIRDVGSYLMSFEVGTPPQRVSEVLLDINSELVWTKCGYIYPNKSSSSSSGRFYPQMSSTIAKEPLCKSSACQSFSLSRKKCSTSSMSMCSFRDTLTGNTVGVLATDKFRFAGGGDPVHVVFGCGLKVAVDDISGVIGLGRGPFSLVNQIGDGRFAYYFAPDGSNDHGFVHFGDDAKPRTPLPLSTPLLESNAHPNFYYVGLTGIQVDGEDLHIPTGTFDLDGSAGGVILSITIPVTFLDEPAYKLLKEALVTKIGLPTANASEELGLDLCYTKASKAKIPAMALVFDGGIVMELHKWNYFYMDADAGLECLTILQSPAKVSVLGNLIQEGTHMIYDVRGNKLQFEPLSFQQQEASTPPQSDSPSSNKGWWSPPPHIFLSLLPANVVWVVLMYVLY